MEHKNHLRLLATISGLVCLGMIASFRQLDGLELEKWHIGIGLLPFILFGFSFLLLMYRSWVLEAGQDFFDKIKIVSFWVITAAFAFIFFALFVIFVL